MLPPLTAVLGVIARFFTKVSPKAMPAILAALSKKAEQTFTTTAQVLAWAKTSPATAFVVVATIAELGHDIWSLFTDKDKATIAAEPGGDIFLGRVQSMLDKDSELSLDLGSSADSDLASDMVVYFRRRWSMTSPADLVRFHTMVRLLGELNSATVRTIAPRFWNAEPVDRVRVYGG